MATPARILAPARMRVDSTLVFPDSTSPFHVVHVGQSAVVLRSADAWHAGDELLTISPDWSGLVPGGACLSRAEFHRVRDEILSLAAPSREVIFDGWCRESTALERVNLVLAAHSISPLSVMMHHRAVDTFSASTTYPGILSPEPLRRTAPGLAERALRGIVHNQTLSAMIGAGPGTTPTGDDIIVGILAGLHVLGLRNEAAVLAGQVEPLLPRTTLASRHYLRSAIQGRFGEHIHDLVNTLARNGRPDQTLDRARRWGATSGVDLLCGLLSILLSSLHNRSNESAA